MTHRLTVEFLWKKELDLHILYFFDMPVACVEPMVRGLIVRTLVHNTDAHPQDIVVCSVERGIALATRWASERDGLIRKVYSLRRTVPEGAADVPEPPSVARWLQN